MTSLSGVTQRQGAKPEMIRERVKRRGKIRGENHRSHISAKRARNRGWRRIPPPDVRSETRRLRKCSS